jgi:hypothetical protein
MPEPTTPMAKPARSGPTSVAAIPGAGTQTPALPNPATTRPTARTAKLSAIDRITSPVTLSASPTFTMLVGSQRVDAHEVTAVPVR